MTAAQTKTYRGEAQKHHCPCGRLRNRRRDCLPHSEGGSRGINVSRASNSPRNRDLVECDAKTFEGPHAQSAESALIDACVRTRAVSKAVDAANLYRVVNVEPKVRRVGFFDGAKAHRLIAFLYYTLNAYHRPADRKGRRIRWLNPQRGHGRNQHPDSHNCTPLNGRRLFVNHVRVESISRCKIRGAAHGR